MMDITVGGGDEAFEEGVGLVRFALEFWMELARDEEGVVFQLDDFDEFAVGRSAAKDEPGFFKFGPVGVIEFVAMPMPFVDQERAVNVVCAGTHDELARLSTETHGAALF